jgi:hypothetical protein
MTEGGRNQMVSLLSKPQSYAYSKEFPTHVSENIRFSRDGLILITSNIIITIFQKCSFVLLPGDSVLLECDTVLLGV